MNVEKYQTKAIRLQLLKPTDGTWAKSGPILQHLLNASARALNHCMSELYVYQHAKDAFHKEHGRYPSKDEMPVPGKRLYHEVREMFPEIASGTAATLARVADQKWRSECKDVFYYQSKSLTSYRAGTILPIRKQGYRIDSIDDDVVLTMTVGSKSWEGVSRLSFLLATRKLDGSQRAALDHILDGSWPAGQLTITKNKKGKTFAIFSYQKPVEKHELNPARIVGVDLGVAKAYYCAVSDSLERQSPCDSDTLHRFRQQIRKRRRSIQSQYRIGGSRKGHGRKTALRPLEKLSEKERNFRNTLYHRYSRGIVAFAIKHNAGTIQIEDLSGLKQAKQGDYMLDGWAIGDLQAKLKYKCAEAGIDLVEVNPRYTSQRCSQCGHISRGNRKDQAHFICEKCGFAENADYNAAINMAIKGIGEIITEKLASGEVTQKPRHTLAKG